MKIDFNNMLEKTIGGHGITETEINTISQRITKVHEQMNAKKGQMAWRALPYNQDEIVKDIVAQGKRINKEFDNFVVFGIGGSALGSKALFTGIKHLKYNELPKEKRGGARFYVVDNVDPDGINALFDIIDVKKTCFHIITKSGNTVETMSQFMIALSMLKDALGDNFKDNIILTTDKEKGILKKISNQYGFKTYTVPDGVGGRFSVLCPVGLLSAAVLNIDIDALFAGAKAMDEACTKESVWENPAYMYAMLMCIAMSNQVNISVMMPYADGLLNMAEWYAQLWAESLGKRVNNDGKDVYCGQTPVRALGVTDQHSQIQLYTEGPFDKVVTFIDVEQFNTTLTVPKTPIDMLDATYIEGQTINKLIASEMRATEYAVTQAGKMNMRITIDKMGAKAIGELFFFFEMATAAAGEFLSIDAFDQPGVEAGKIATFALMGREGYEKKAKELNKADEKDQDFVFQV
ncbi:glucose-6-phosphate isomerase [Christensenellaceae bacterium OttesenSCG-928-K19]|nr:glucose-6-phosphate isomerase [Christensenellaceae bacterium OttesenSCG-928-K19]